MDELGQSLVPDMYPPTPLLHGLSSLGSTHRLHSKPAPGQDVGQMLWRVHLSTYVGPTHACRQDQLLLPRLECYGPAELEVGVG